MWTLNLRVGIAELIALAGVAGIAAIIVVAIALWPLAAVPAATYGIAMCAGYGLYRRFSREEKHVKTHEALARGVTFRVVETRGACPLGRRAGDVLTVGEGRVMGPPLCPEALGVLRLAARDGNVKQWCCPVYEHLLVFEREKVAA